MNSIKSNNVLCLVLIIVAFVAGGCRSIVSEGASFKKGEIVTYALYEPEIEVVQVISTNLVHASSRIGGLRIAIIPKDDSYVNGQRVRRGRYEYMGPYTYQLIKDGFGNDDRTNTIRLFKELPSD